MKSDKKENRFNLALDDKDTAVLDNLASQLKRRRTDILREALREYGKQRAKPLGKLKILELEPDEGSWIIQLPNGRHIHIHYDYYLNIDTQAGHVHVVDDGDTTRISLYDHFEVTIEGTHKNHPTVTIDSDEYPTGLVIRETERPWESFRDERMLSRLKK